MKTGGGHLAPAKSLCKEINRITEGKISPKLIDGFHGSGKFIKELIEGGYRRSQSKAVWTFELLYMITKIRFIALFAAKFVSYFVKKNLKKVILENKPKKIVIFHFFLIIPLNQIIRELKLETEVITVVTDPYTAHPIWFLEKNQNLVIFSDELKQKLSHMEPSSKMNVFPFIIDEKFSKKMSENQICDYKQKIGIEKNKNVILLLGGGDGIKNGKKIIENMIKYGPDSHYIVVCGNNNSLYHKLYKFKFKHELDNLMILGFVDNIYELINISNLVITKCGASTFMEILISGKIPIVNSYIWEQEKGNVDFITANSMGIYEKKIKELPKVANLLQPSSPIYGKFLSNIANSRLRSGVNDVSRFILQ